MTKKNFSDMVLYKLYGGVPDAGGPIDERDVWDSLEHKVNEQFSMRQFSVNLPSGETIPDNLSLGLYEDIDVISYNTAQSKSTLPLMPVSLPRNVGIYEIRPVLSVVDAGDRILGDPIIPLLAGQDFLLKADSLLNNMLGQFAYTPRGLTVVYNTDLTKMGITKVDMQLIVFNMSLYSINDELPIPADYIGKIEDELIAEFAPVFAESGYVNNFTTANQTAPNNANQKQ